MMVEFEIRKNGVAIPGSQQIMVLKGSDLYLPITLMGMTEVAPNDRIEIWGKSPAYTGWTVEKMMVTAR
ncbi:MAG: hypothetical protein EOP49_28205 [Sphingobacteriales bacterium]|nr:MAG: hypothetical protein EOP49_28205 [Sphingobacteriales bacterium]